MSADIKKKLAESLKSAMQAEVEGHHFYLMAAQSTQDPKGKEVFEALAREELDHAEFLKNQYRSVIEEGKLDASLRLGPRTDLSITNPIFSKELRSRVKDAHFEMTALSVGIQLELTAEKYYKKCSEEASEPLAKKFFAELAEWEAGHYHAMLRQQEELKEDYWSSGGFAPF